MNSIKLVTNAIHLKNYVARKVKYLHGDKTKNIMLLDNDTILEDSFFIQHDLLEDPCVAGYCIGIAIIRTPPLNLWEVAIDYEYGSISYTNQASSSCSSMRFIHGISTVYKLGLMIKMYCMNWSLPGDFLWIRWQC